MEISHWVERIPLLLQSCLTYSMFKARTGEAVKGVYKSDNKKSDNKFRDWFSQIKVNTIRRLPVTISLLDETSARTMVWTLTNAWPTKITGTDLKSDDMEVVIGTLEVVHKGISIDHR
jgi:phage tail-like protein